jgi:DNA-binding transcriptional LysR family regulator
MPGAAMIDLDQVRSFVSVIEAGSFRDAAQRLDIAQPTVSQHVQKLEATLGHLLIERNRARAATTAAGLRFLPFAKALLRLEERAHAALDGGNLVIGASSNIGVYLLQPMVRAFASAQPSVGAIDIRIGTNPETARRLQDAEVDIALMEWWDDRPGFEAAVWRREKLVVIVPTDHPWARRKSVEKAMLLREPMIGGEPGTGTARLLQQTFGIDAGSLKIGLELGSTEAVKQAVRAGLGISITLESAVRDEVRAGTLRALRVTGAPLAKPLFSIFPAGLAISSPATRFHVFLRDATRSSD